MHSLTWCCYFLLFVVFLSSSIVDSVNVEDESTKPLTILGMESPHRIDNHYIVIYKPSAQIEAVTSHMQEVVLKGATMIHKYHFGDFKGFAAVIENQSLLESLLTHPLVEAVHCDVVEFAIENSCGATQTPSSSWGLARVSHKGSIDNGINAEYYFSVDNSGSGVTAYIIDTGIYINHNDFQGRASYGANFVDDVQTDENGHGTHCAGTVGGYSYGVAKAVKLVAVKVLGSSGSGSTAGVIAGIQWVTQQHEAKGGPSVASMSLGSTSDGGKNAAIAASTKAGVVYSVAAGNSNYDACQYYPASSPDAITVGSTMIGELDTVDVDVRSTFSNYGKCVDIFAPGSEITSCGIKHETSSAIKSGTSMACPHVTGAIALLLQLHPTANAENIRKLLIAQSQVGFIQNVGPESPNNLVYNGCDEL